MQVSVIMIETYGGSTGVAGVVAGEVNPLYEVNQLLRQHRHAWYERVGVMGLGPEDPLATSVFVALIEPDEGERNVMAVCADEAKANWLCAIVGQGGVKAYCEPHRVKSALAQAA